MESRETISSGVTIIAPEAPSSYHMAPRADITTLGKSPEFCPPVATGIPISSGKKKRGRPRKYGPDGEVTRTLSPTPLSLSAPPISGSLLIEKASVARPALEKKPRNKAGTENLGRSISSSTGGNFLPHIFLVRAGEDISKKIAAFSQQGPRAICIISAYGSISNATVRQPNSSGGTLTYEGRFEIVSLSGVFTPPGVGGSCTSKTGGLSITLVSPDGRVVGGTLAGMLLAATTVQIVVASFLPSNCWPAKPRRPKAERQPIPYATISQEPRSSNAHTNNSGAGTQNVVSSASTQSNNNRDAMRTIVHDSRKPATDINISLQRE